MRSIAAGRGTSAFVDFLHVAAASFWLGGLVALGLALSSSGDHAPLVRRFSNVAFVSVLVLAATGVLRAFAELRSVGQLWSTGYGQLLIVKTALLAVLAAIGWVNRYRLVPRIVVRWSAPQCRGRADVVCGAHCRGRVASPIYGRGETGPLPQS